MLRPLAAACAVAALLLSAPAQAGSAQQVCDGKPVLRCIPGDPFRPCGPIIVCPR